MTRPIRMDLNSDLRPASNRGPFRVFAESDPPGDSSWSAPGPIVTTNRAEAGVFERLWHAQARADLLNRTHPTRQFNVVDQNGEVVRRDHLMMDQFYRDPMAFEATEAKRGPKIRLPSCATTDSLIRGLP